ncbi:5-formyltetrahydrofolate cyclo-ligase [Halostagnicola kamekurae]|nr:5-formyltetrahydrofolate cyclo-ligase [Halostagnicola kamekurae]
MPTPSKQDIRERVWDDLEESGEARFPFPPHGRIPNFAGAKAAADRLAARPEWNRAETIKANPDAPQLPVRRRALREGKTVYMAVPRLRDERCFLRLDPDELEDYDAATTVSGSSEHGVQVGPEAVSQIDLIVSGSVAVGTDEGSSPGARIGKGEGYSDLEYAILTELGLVDEETPVATTVHERQCIDEEIPTTDHDVPMDLIVTPDRALEPDDAVDRGPSGIDWALLSDERLEEIPVLDQLR